MTNNIINEKGLTKTNGVKNKFEIFDYNNLGSVRAYIDRNGEKWFCLVDVCNILGLGNPSQVVTRLEQPWVISN